MTKKELKTALFICGWVVEYSIYPYQLVKGTAQIVLEPRAGTNTFHNNYTCNYDANPYNFEIDIKKFKSFKELYEYLLEHALL